MKDHLASLRAHAEKELDPMQRRRLEMQAEHQAERPKLDAGQDLIARSTSDLRGLLRITFDALASSAPESPDRSTALPSLDTIQAELATRPDGP